MEFIKGLIKSVGKELKRKGKRIFMPYRIALTGRLQGPELSKILKLVNAEKGEVSHLGTFVPLASRMETLKAWLQEQAAS